MVRHGAKESLSEEPSLDGEVTKTKKEEGAQGRRRRLIPLLLKTKGVVVCIQRRQRAVEFFPTGLIKGATDRATG